MNPQRTMLIQYRADWTSFPLAWDVPGGACDSHETPEAATLREAAEETRLLEHQLHILNTQVIAGPFPANPDHLEPVGGQEYHAVYALTAEEPGTNPNDESLELRWIPLNDVDSLNLLLPFVES